MSEDIKQSRYQASPSLDCSPWSDYIGKRVLIIWTDKAYNQGYDWISFVIESAAENGLLLRGCDSPDGSRHVGNTCVAHERDIRDVILWEDSEQSKPDKP